MSNISTYSFQLDNLDDDDDDVRKCEYYSVNKINNLNINDAENFSIFHQNIHSLEKHIDEIRILLDTLNFRFDFLCFSETKITDGIAPILDITLSGYQDPIDVPTEANKGGVVIYVRDGIDFKLREDLHMYSSKELESVFIEIINTNDKNSIIGVVHQYCCIQ